MFKLFKKDARSSEEKFWNWFLANEAKFFNFELENADEIFAMLEGESSKIHPSLSFEFGPIRDGKQEFVISASGIHEAFPFVERLFDAAPAMERWTITKFKPRRSIAGTAFDFKGKVYDPEHIFYKLKSYNNKRIGVQLFIEGYASEGGDALGEIGFICLDSALGEYDVETKLSSIDFFDVDSPEYAGAKPMTELVSDFDKFQKEFNNGS